MIYEVGLRVLVVILLKKLVSKLYVWSHLRKYFWRKHDDDDKATPKRRSIAHHFVPSKMVCVYYLYYLFDVETDKVWEIFFSQNFRYMVTSRRYISWLKIVIRYRLFDIFLIKRKVKLLWRGDRTQMR